MFPTRPRAFSEAAKRGAPGGDGLEEMFARYRRTTRSWRVSSDSDSPEAAAGLDENLPTFDVRGRPPGHAQGLGQGAQRHLAPTAPAGGRLSRPRALQQHLHQGSHDLSADDPGGRNFFFGVREHAMGAILNGMALSGMLLPYGGTFLIFSDYMRPAIRLAALMGLPVKYVFTHDSVFVGEDGPTHQPISQLLSLRAIPGLTVIRPADANETAAAWRVAIERQDGPTALALSRQSLPVIDQAPEEAVEGVARGAYVVADPAEGEPQLMLIASGSEVSLALDARHCWPSRDRGPCRELAVLGPLRRPGSRLPGERPAACDHEAAGHRGRDDAGLGALCRQPREMSSASTASEPRLPTRPSPSISD